MKSLNIGPSDLVVGEIAYGCWRFAQNSPTEAHSLIDAAIGSGMNLIDTADIYGYGDPSKYTQTGFGEAEAVLGAVLKRSPQLRKDIVLATKGGIIPPRPYDSSALYLTQALDDSLRRLNTDYVDLYMIHRPDISTSFEQTGAALDALVKSGKTRYIGVSNFTATQTAALQAQMTSPIISHQNEFSALEQSPITDGVLDQCQERGLTFMAWSPLAGGNIATGDVCPSHENVLMALDKLADHYETSRSQIALAFILRHPANTLAIIGTQNISRIAQAAAAAQISLSARHWYDIIEAYRGVEMP